MEDILMETEKKESKKLKNFQKLFQQISQSQQYKQSRQSSRGNVYKETGQEPGISGNTGTITK